MKDHPTNILIAIPSYNNVEGRNRLISQFEAGYRGDNCPSVISIINIGNKLSLSGMWNMAILMAKARKIRWVVLVNDDVYFEDPLKSLISIQEMVEAMVYDIDYHKFNLPSTYDENKPVAVVSALEEGRGDDTAGLNGSFFAFDVSIIDTVGYFDENFYPAYYEDNDFQRRLDLAYLQCVVYKGCRFKHQGSSTLHLMSDLERTFANDLFIKNGQYYVEKWGGYPGEEKYIYPFNKKI